MSNYQSTSHEAETHSDTDVEAKPDEPTNSHPRPWRQALRAARLLFTPVAILFLLYLGWQSKSELLQLYGSANLTLLLIAALAWATMNLLGPLLATVLLRGLGYEFGYYEAARIHIKNLPARYLPGGIWHTVGRVVDYRRIGIKDRDIATFVFLENALALTTALAIGGSVIGWFRGPQGWGLIATVGAIAGSAAVILLPFLSRSRLPNYVTGPAIRAYVIGVVVVAFSWCVAAGGFSTFVIAFHELSSVASPLELAGIYLFSWAAGFIAVFAPQGIGIFEVVAAEMIRDSYSLANTTALLVTLRLIIMVADVTVWASGLLVFRLTTRNQRTLAQGHTAETRSNRT